MEQEYPAGMNWLPHRWQSPTLQNGPWDPAKPPINPAHWLLDPQVQLAKYEVPPPPTPGQVRFTEYELPLHCPQHEEHPPVPDRPTPHVCVRLPSLQADAALSVDAARKGVANS